MRMPVSIPKYLVFISTIALLTLGVLGNRSYGALRPQIYWTDSGTGKVQRADLDGSNVEDLGTVRGIMGLALDVANRKIYWTRWTFPDVIQRADLDSPNVQDLVRSRSGSFLRGIALDKTNGKMYWTVAGNLAGIQRADLDGSNVTDLFLFGSCALPGGIALDSIRGKMYWTKGCPLTGGAIQCADLDGSNVEDLVTELRSPIDVALDVGNGKIYWTDMDTYKIQRADLDGSNVTDLVTGLKGIRGVALDVGNGKIYWTDMGTRKIQRADLDGSNVTDLVTGLVKPFHIALSIPAQSVPVANTIVKISGDNQKGAPGKRLTKALVVEVRDNKGDPVKGVSVKFQITAGNGSLSRQMDTTDRNGRAETELTLGNQPGLNTVQASTLGVSKPITFNAMSEPQVLIAAAHRPPMYWIDTQAGTLHRLVGNKVENLVPSVQNATSLAVDITGEKMYWLEKTSGRTGNIRVANLKGENVQLVKELTSVPLSTAVDTTNGRLYLTNAWGKIQRLNVDGTNFQPNLITGLEASQHLALDIGGDKVYWTEQTSERSSKIRRANLDGSNVELVKELTSVAHGLAIDAANGRLYLTNAWGKVQRLNVDGANFQPNLITGLEAPQGIAVDVAGGKIYWTEKSKLRRANLNGEDIQDIVIGLGAPAGITLGTVAASAAVVAAPALRVGPNQTVLLPNYPNPFNPETWIPYQLATAAEVTLTIYAVDGQVVRTLALGHQPAGIYQSRSRAVYWDGRNAQGEPVASGVYFYTLIAGDFTTTRKMLIRK